MKITNTNNNTPLTPLKRGINRESLSAKPPTSTPNGRQALKKGINTALTIVVAIFMLLIIISAFPVTGNYKIFVVQSGSMEPAIHTGSVVVVFPEKNYKEKDVITFKGKNSKLDSITHRIVKTEDSGSGKVFTTKGDANNANDINTVSSDKVIGKVLFSVPYFGYAVAAAKTSYGFMALIIIPAALVIYDEVKKIRKELLKNKKKDLPR